MLEKLKIGTMLALRALRQPSMMLFAIRENGLIHALRRFSELGPAELQEKARLLEYRTKSPTPENLSAYYPDVRFEQSDDALLYKVRVASGEMFYIRRAHAWDDMSVLHETFSLGVYARHPPLNEKTVLDIGAHIGDTAVYFAKRGAQVTAFEPDSQLCELARRNVALNELRADIRNVGIGGKTEALLLSTTRHGADQASVTLFPGSTPFDRFHDSTAPVQVVSLADVLMTFASVDLLKLDCEGCEYPALQSVPIDALRKIEHIVMECHGRGDELAGTLRAAGFSVRTDTTAYVYADRLPSTGTTTSHPE